MAMKLIGASYPIEIIGDGSATSVAVDFYDQIDNDHTVHDKVPDGIFDIQPHGIGVSGILSGTTVTFTWTTAPSATIPTQLSVALTFPLN